jgi:hypothetical protein
MRTTYLSRVDIRTIPDRSTDSITLRYTGRRLRFSGRLYGYPDGTFFVVKLSEVPLPEKIVALADAMRVDLSTLPLAVELRRAVADELLAEAIMDAPEQLALFAEPQTAWNQADIRDLEHKMLAAETRVADVARALEASLRARERKPLDLPAVRRSYDPMPPATMFGGWSGPPPSVRAPQVTEVEEEEVVQEVDDGPVETSEATGRRVMAAVRAAREQELPQRLPGGARRALERLPPGLYLSHGAQLLLQQGICAAMVNGAESGKRSGESTVIDWDGEWPVVARRYGSHGRIVYRLEEALRRNGISFSEAA